MPANLPPQFYTLSLKLKETKDNDEKISILEEMLAICPKHKGTEKLQKDIKIKIAKLKRESPKKTRGEALYYIQKEGAGQVIILGPPNSGKSSLLNTLTNAQAEVASYPFTTKIPQPAMMPYENILIQLIDTPPLVYEPVGSSSPFANARVTKEFSPLWLKAMIKEAEGLVVIFDLSKENVEKDIKDLKEILNNWGLNNKKIIFLGNKVDLEMGKENLKKLETQYEIKPISCSQKIGLEELKKEIFDLLEVVRVYTKSKNQPAPDFSHPFILKKGERLITLASQIHHDLLPSFKYAKLFKKNAKNPKIIGKDYILEDGDIVEIYT